MPVVPIDQNRVAPAEGVSARLRAPDMSGTGLEALGRGVQQLGQAGQQYAVTQDEIQAHADRISARDAALRAQGDINGALTDYTSLQGKDASDQGAAFQQRIGEIRKQYVEKAGNPRQRQFLDEMLGAQTLQANNAIAEHSKRELFTYTKTTYASGVTLAQQSAAQFHDNPEMADKAKAEGFAYLDKLGHLEGWDANTAAVKRLEYTSGIHNAVLDNMKTAPVPMVDAIKAYGEAHANEMTADARNNLAAWLQKPLQDRKMDDIFLAASSGAKTVGAPAAAAGTYQSPVAGGKVTNTFAQHQERGSAGYDIAAPAGSAIHPIAGGTVTEVTQDDRAGKWVMVKHPDGTTSTYAHMGNQSVKVGDEVSAQTVLGTVGMTGHTTGPHVHLRTRDAEGNDVDPAKLLGTKPAITSGTTTARNYDQATVISNIKAMGLGPEEEKLAIDHARQKMNESESLYADQQQDIGQKVQQWVGDWITKNGDYPPPTALPSWASGWDGLSQLRGSLTERQKAKSDKAAADAANWTALQATLRMYNDPQGFLTADIPKEYMGKVSSGDFAQIVTAQARMRADASKPQAWDPFGDSNKALNDYLMLNPAGKLDDKAKAAALQTIKDAATVYAEKKGAPPSTSEWYDIAKRAMGTTKVPGMLYGSREVPVYTVADVPDDVKPAIIAAWKRRNPNKGNPPDSEILRLYRLNLTGQPQ